MKKLSEIPSGNRGRITNINGDRRFLSRITSIGLTPGCDIEVIKNSKSQPLLVYGRDTLIAVNRRECDHIFLEERSQ